MFGGCWYVWVVGLCEMIFEVVDVVFEDVGMLYFCC